MQNQNRTPVGAVTIRRLGRSDGGALARLAQLDSEAPLAEPALGAEVEGKLLAAVSLDDGRVVSDPFSRTEELRALLALRARQFYGRDAGRRRRGAVGRPRRHASVGSSPPGAGGRLLTLLPRV